MHPNSYFQRPRTAIANTNARMPWQAQTVLERLESVDPVGGLNGPLATGVKDPLKGRKVRLSLVDATDAVPRVLRAFVKVGKIECGLVIRPLDGQGVLVHAESGQAWKWVGLASDVPLRPDVPVSVEDGTLLLREAQNNLPAPTQIELRSKWMGYLHCESGVPQLILTRQIATYGLLRVFSDAEASVWKWTVERKQAWYSTSSVNDGAAPKLKEAIEQGLASAYGLLGEACVVRDTHRRQAFDPEYAQAHPIRLRVETRDPITRFNSKPAPIPVQKPTEAETSAAPARRGRPRKNEAGAPPAQSQSPAPQPPAKRGRKPKNPVLPAPPAVTDPYTLLLPPLPPEAPAPVGQGTPQPPIWSHAPVPPPPQASAETVDPAKDLALLNAFEGFLDKTLSNLANK